MTIYTENHHIIPRHMGGTDDPSNLIKLTVEEHAEAHRKLWEEHGHIQDKVAWLAISGKIGKEEMMKMLLGSNKGRKFSEESRKKMSMTHLGSKRSEETRKKMSESNRKRFAQNPHSEETRRKISEARRRVVSTKKLSSTD